MKFEGVTVRFPKWIESAPPRISRRPKSPHLLGLRLFVKQGLTDETGLICKSDEEGLEDVEIGKCMENLGVKAGDSRDSLGRGRFFPSVTEEMIFPVQKWLWYLKILYILSCL